MTQSISTQNMLNRFFDIATQICDEILAVQSDVDYFELWDMTPNRSNKIPLLERELLQTMPTANTCLIFVEGREADDGTP